ncbi:PA3496 family putative envelope integrity protein [Thalassotalea agariperforans]
MNKHSRSAYNDDLEFNDSYNPQLNQSDFDYDNIESQPRNGSKRHRSMNNYLVRKKIEARQEARRLRDLIDDEYDDWN